MKNTLKKGDRVIIYAKPITNEEPEGEAILLSPYNKDMGTCGFQLWNVKFVSDNFKCVRNVAMDSKKIKK